MSSTASTTSDEGAASAANNALEQASKGYVMLIHNQLDEAQRQAPTSAYGIALLQQHILRSDWRSHSIAAFRRCGQQQPLVFVSQRFGEEMGLGSIEECGGINYG